MVVNGFAVVAATVASYPLASPRVVPTDRAPRALGKDRHAYPVRPLVAGLALFAAGLGPVAAQDATPVAGEATPATDQAPIEILFVQSFESATLEAGDEEGTFSLALTGTPEQLAFFADRPIR